MSQGFVKPSSVGKGHDTRHSTQYDGRLPVSCLEYEYVSISPPLRCSFVAEYAVSPLGCVCVSMDRHHFSATGETLHKHKFAFNASLLRFVKRTLERIPCFVVFFSAFLQACGILSYAALMMLLLFLLLCVFKRRWRRLSLAQVTAYVQSPTQTNTTCDEVSDQFHSKPTPPMSVQCVEPYTREGITINSIAANRPINSRPYR